MKSNIHCLVKKCFRRDMLKIKTYALEMLEVMHGKRKDSGNMLSIGLKSLNKLFLEPLGLMLCREMGYLGDWIIVDIETRICASWQDNSIGMLKAAKKPVRRAIRFNNGKDAVQHIVKQLVSSIEAFRVARRVATPDGYKHMEIVELKNPLFKAKSIEEAMVRLDLMV